MNTQLRTVLTAGGMATLLALGFSTPATALTTPRKPATVSVKNTRDVPVEVFLDQEPFDIRLGTVAGHAEKSLTLPPIIPENGPVRIIVHPEGGMDLATPDLDPRPGAELKVLVPLNDVGYVMEPAPEIIPNPGDGTTTVTVQNHRAQPVTLYIERGDYDLRVGTAAPDRETTLLLPRWLAEDGPSVEIFVHPEHGVDLTSHYFDLEPGAHLLVKVPAPAH